MSKEIQIAAAQMDIEEAVQAGVRFIFTATTSATYGRGVSAAAFKRADLSGYRKGNGVYIKND